MAFERFTDRARRVLVIAQEFAVEDGHFIGADHIVLALRREEDGIAGHALRALGVDEEAIRAASHKRKPPKEAISPKDALSAVGIDVAKITESLGEDELHLPSDESPAFAVDAKKVLENSLRQALALQHNYLGTEHLLLGVLAEDNSGTAVLSDVGIDSEALRERVLGLIG